MEGKRNGDIGRSHSFLHGERDRVLRASHIILSSPPPPVCGSMAMVNWSTVLSSEVFFRSTRASSFAFSVSSL